MPEMGDPGLRQTQESHSTILIPSERKHRAAGSENGDHAKEEFGRSFLSGVLELSTLNMPTGINGQTSGKKQSQWLKTFTSLKLLQDVRHWIGGCFHVHMLL